LNKNKVSSINNFPKIKIKIKISKEFSALQNLQQSNLKKYSSSNMTNKKFMKKKKEKTREWYQ